MSRLYLVGCGKSKRPGVLPACEKYDSSYFGLKWNHYEEFGDRAWILSALYGVLEPRRRIADYNVTIHTTDPEFSGLDLKDSGAFDEWVAMVRAQLKRIPAFNNPDNEVVLLAGKKYLDPIEETLRDLPVECVWYFEDTTGFGDQMGKLKRDVEEANA